MLDEFQKRFEALQNNRMHQDSSSADTSDRSKMSLDTFQKHGASHESKAKKPFKDTAVEKDDYDDNDDNDDNVVVEKRKKKRKSDHSEAQTKESKKKKKKSAKTDSIPKEDKDPNKEGGQDTQKVKSKWKIRSYINDDDDDDDNPDVAQARRKRNQNKSLVTKAVKVKAPKTQKM